MKTLLFLTLFLSSFYSYATFLQDDLNHSKAYTPSNPVDKTDLPLLKHFVYSFLNPTPAQPPEEQPQGHYFFTVTPVDENITRYTGDFGCKGKVDIDIWPNGDREISYYNALSELIDFSCIYPSRIKPSARINALVLPYLLDK